MADWNKYSAGPIAEKNGRETGWLLERGGEKKAERVTPRKGRAREIEKPYQEREAGQVLENTTL